MQKPSNGTFTLYTCIGIPPKINSAGLARQFVDHVLDYKWMDYTTPRVMLLISSMFILAQAFHSLLIRFGIPIFISQIFAGIFLSRSALEVVKMADKIITPDIVQLIDTIGHFGFSFFMFLSGVKMDARMVAKVGRKALYVGILSVVSPLAFNFALSSYFNRNTVHKGRKGFYVSPTYYITSFPVVISHLAHLKILNSELGRLAQSSAIVADCLSYISILCMTFLKLSRISTQEAFLAFADVLVYIIIVMFVVRPVMLLIVRLTSEGRQVSQTGLSVVLLIFLLCMRCLPRFFTEFRVVGLYILGLAVPHGPPLGSTLVNKFDCLVSGLFVPIFVTASAMRVADWSIHSFKNMIMMKNITVAAGTILIKFVACLLPLLYWKVHKNDAIALALIMNTKGIVEMAYHTFESDATNISYGMFRFMLCIVVIMGSIVPIFVRKLYNPSRKYAGYQIRKLVDCSPNSELQIISCIHVPNNISSAINLLSISCPRRESPIAVSALHLIKLNDQATPIFVSHQKKNNHISAYNYSENVILSFKKFEGLHWEAVSVNAFTAISPPDIMHDDICTLALDTLASLIILPFHRTWYIDGSLESEDLTVRNLNRIILEKAPCSVGILVDHGNIKRPVTHLDSSSDLVFNVAMMFVGGNDDREALTYAKRMAGDDKVRLTVVHFIAANDDRELHWETILDSEVLRDAKNSEYIRYLKYVVQDGAETVKIIHSMVNEYNLVIVGRRNNLESPQTSCLKEWSEFPELGILGDLLASKDLGGKCCVLVMQQQKKLI